MAHIHKPNGDMEKGGAHKASSRELAPTESKNRRTLEELEIIVKNIENPHKKVFIIKQLVELKGLVKNRDAFERKAKKFREWLDKNLFASQASEESASEEITDVIGVAENRKEATIHTAEAQVGATHPTPEEVADVAEAVTEYEKGATDAKKELENGSILPEHEAASQESDPTEYTNDPIRRLIYETAQEGYHAANTQKKKEKPLPEKFLPERQDMRYQMVTGVDPDGTVHYSPSFDTLAGLRIFIKEFSSVSPTPLTFRVTGDAHDAFPGKIAIHIDSDLYRRLKNPGGVLHSAWKDFCGLRDQIQSDPLSMGTPALAEKTTPPQPEVNQPTSTEESKLYADVFPQATVERAEPRLAEDIANAQSFDQLYQALENAEKYGEYITVVGVPYGSSDVITKIQSFESRLATGLEVSNEELREIPRGEQNEHLREKVIELLRSVWDNYLAQETARQEEPAGDVTLIKDAYGKAGVAPQKAGALERLKRWGKKLFGAGMPPRKGAEITSVVTPIPEVVAPTPEAPLFTETPGAPKSPETVLAGARTTYAAAYNTLRKLEPMFRKQGENMETVMTTMRNEYLVNRDMKDVSRAFVKDTYLWQRAFETMKARVAYEDARIAIGQTLRAENQSPLDMFQKLIVDEHTALEKEKLAGWPPSTRKRLWEAFRGITKYWTDIDPKKRMLITTAIAAVAAGYTGGLGEAGLAVIRRGASALAGGALAGAVGKKFEEKFGEHIAESKRMEREKGMLSSFETGGLSLQAITELENRYHDSFESWQKEKTWRVLAKTSAMLATGFATGRGIGYGTNFFEHWLQGPSATDTLESVARHGMIGKIEKPHTAMAESTRPESIPTETLKPSHDQVGQAHEKLGIEEPSAAPANIEELATVRKGEGAWQAVYRQLEERLGKSPKTGGTLNEQTAQILKDNHFLNQDGTTRYGIDHAGVRLILDKDNNVHMEDGKGPLVYPFESRHHGASPAPATAPIPPHISGHAPVETTHLAEPKTPLQPAEAGDTPLRSFTPQEMRASEVLPESPEGQGQFIAQHLGIKTGDYDSFEKTRIGDFMDKMRGKHAGDMINYRGIPERVTQDHLWFNEALQEHESQGSESMKSATFGDIFEEGSPGDARQISHMYERLATGTDVPDTRADIASEVVTPELVHAVPARATPAPAPAPVPTPELKTDSFAEQPKSDGWVEELRRTIRKYNNEHLPKNLDFSLSGENGAGLAKEIGFVTNSGQEVFKHSRVGEFLKTIDTLESAGADPVHRFYPLTIPDLAGEHGTVEIALSKEHFWLDHAIKRLDLDPSDLNDPQMTFDRLFEKYGQQIFAAYDRIKKGE